MAEPMSSSQLLSPREPGSLEDTGLAESAVERLILNILYSHGDLYGQDLSSTIGLRFSVIQQVVEYLKLRHHIQIKSSIGMGGVGAQYALTESGRVRAHEALEVNQYSGPAPVPLAQYIEQVRRQRPQPGWLTTGALSHALSGMVITQQVLSQVGPAVSSGNSMLVYGKPGDGKTFLIESLNNIEAKPVYVPYAIECQGNIVQVYDPIYHQAIEEEQPSVLTISREVSHDRRWVKCKRPFIVSGGELSLDMLDLRYNQISKVYEAPFQLKANNGVYLIDDFGRQRATPVEVLNRWIVPMERRVDYLSFLTGGKMTAPFDAFVVFSTNLNPADLGDEAFLRRIQYKMLLRGPSVQEFVRIFESSCAARRLPCAPGVVDRFVEKRYKRTGKVFRRCHPRDVICHAWDLMHFENLPLELTDKILDRAFESCFVQDLEDGSIEDSVMIVRAPAKPCAGYWAERATLIPTAFGRLAFAASFRDSGTLEYRDPVPSDYEAAENARTLQKLHSDAFGQWLDQSVDQQTHDFAGYIATPEGRAAYLSFGRRELVRILTPSGAQALEDQRYNDNLSAAVLALSHHPAGGVALPTQLEKIA
jgi:hypothetical protein